MPTTIVQALDDFDDLRDQWNHLTLEPLRSFTWHRNWWKTYGQDWQLRIYAFHQHGRLKGVAPFFVDRWLRQDRLRFIGSGTVCSDYAQIIAAPEIKDEFVKQIIDDIQNHSSVSIVELDGYSDSHGDQSLCSQLQDSNYWRYDRPIGSTWVLELPDSWNTLVDTQSKSLRRKINRATARIESGEVTVRSSLHDLNLNSALETLADLHRKQSASKSVESVFEDPCFRQFLQQVTDDLAPQNRVEILVAYQDNLPIGAHLYWKSDDGPQMYQSSACPNASKLEPSHLLLTYALKKAIAQGCKVYDFLRSPKAATPSWNAIPRRLTLARCVSNRFLPSAINRGYQMLHQMKAAVRNRARH